MGDFLLDFRRRGERSEAVGLLRLDQHRQGDGVHVRHDPGGLPVRVAQ